MPVCMPTDEVVGDSEEEEHCCCGCGGCAAKVAAEDDEVAETAESTAEGKEVGRVGPAPSIAGSDWEGPPAPNGKCCGSVPDPENIL